MFVRAASETQDDINLGGYDQNQANGDEGNNNSNTDKALLLGNAGKNKQV